MGASELPPVFVDDGQPILLGARVAALQSRLWDAGVRPGSIVGIRPTTKLGFLAAYQACTESGAVALILGRGESYRSHAIAAGASHLIVDSGDTPSLEEVASSPRWHVPDGVHLILETSGSTGEPKLITQTKAATDYQCDAMIRRLGYLVGDRLFVGIPPWSAYGLTLVHVWQRFDASMVFCTSSFPDKVIQTVRQAAATSVDSAPQLYALWLKRAKMTNAPLDCPTVRLWCVGGDYLPPAVAEEWPAVGSLPLLDGYGLGEAGGNVAINGPDDFELGTVGRPYEGTEVRFGEDGEVLVRSPSVTPGYWKAGDVFRPASLMADGWLATGDLGSFSPRGCLKISGRKKNVVVVNGYKVYPEVVEDALRACVGVVDCAVIGVPSQIRGERLIAAVEFHGQKPSTASLRRWLGTKLDADCIPSEFFARESLPRSANGKLDRRAILRDVLETAQRGAEGPNGGNAIREDGEK